MNDDEIRDIAIDIVDELVVAGHVPDCIDTEDETEFAVQDIIFAKLKSLNLKRNESQTNPSSS